MQAGNLLTILLNSGKIIQKSVFTWLIVTIHSNPQFRLLVCLCQYCEWVRLFAKYGLGSGLNGHWLCPYYPEAATAQLDEARWQNVHNLVST